MDVSVFFLVWNRKLSHNYEVVGEAQRIDAYRGLKALTINGAYQYFKENTKGSLKAGKLADLVILDKKPLKVDPMILKDIRVMEAIKEVKQVYARKWQQSNWSGNPAANNIVTKA